MPTVTLELHDGGRRRVVIDLDRLSPRARALAEIVATRELHTRCPIILESDRTLREMGATDVDAAFYGAEAMDYPHRVMWDNWAHYPSQSEMDPHDYLEIEARKLPMGYYPVGRSVDQRVPSADSARDHTRLIPKAQVLDLLRKLGRPISSGTLYNYTSKAPADWPGVAEYIGRTPMWDRAAIEAYAASR